MLPLLVPQAVRYCAAQLPPADALPPSPDACVGLELLLYLAVQPRTPAVAAPAPIAAYAVRVIKALPKIFAPSTAALSTSDYMFRIAFAWTSLSLCRWLRIAFSVGPAVKALCAAVSSEAVEVRWWCVSLLLARVLFSAVRLA